jgi:hypothetical protein
LWTRYVLKEEIRYGDNLLAGLKAEDGVGFRNFVRMTQRQ